jgi:DNA-binding LytR/AlgR family response regulator
LRVVVIDDEAPARRRLVRMLAEVGDVEVVGEAQDGLEALEVAERKAPDLLFLDIHMPGVDGLALAAQYARLPPVVFVTAYDEHALAAFELNAVDYLLKPVRLERLDEAVRRARARMATALESFRALPPVPSPFPRIVTHEQGAIRLFDARTIRRFSSSDKYTVFLADGAEHLTEEPLSALEKRLSSHGFVRVHRAELVRASAIVALCSEERGNEARLDDGQVARVSRRLLAQLKRELGL